MSGSNDGKYLEEGLDRYLKTITETEFCFRRLHDTRAARRGMISQPADFDLCYKGVSVHIECKTSGSTTGLLKTFSQYADLRRWGMAGKPGYVLAHFYRLDRLYLVPVAYLEPASSWNLLRHYPGQELTMPGGKITKDSGLLLNIFGVEPK